jgi:hypothetical protein
MEDARSGEIHQALEARRVQDTKIQQKVMAAHREAFKEKFPGQVEHILRLVAERLQQGLRKDNPVELTATEVESLAQALNSIYDIHCDTKAE